MLFKYDVDEDKDKDEDEEEENEVKRSEEVRTRLWRTILAGVNLVLRLGGTKGGEERREQEGRESARC